MAVTDVLVIGGGLAGLTAAVRLRQRGKRVVLIEARPVFGGRTSSWNADGMIVESGLHRYLGIYRAMPRLYRDIGMSINDVVIWEDEVEIRLPGDRPSHVIGFSPLRKPFKTARMLVNQRSFLQWKDKRSLLRVMASGLWHTLRNKELLDRQTIADFATSRGITRHAMERVITPFSTGLFFLPPERYSAYAFFAPLLPALMRPHRLGVAAFNGGMSDVVAAPLVNWLRAHGVSMQTGAPAEQLLVERGAAVGARILSESIHASHVILATTLGAAQRLVRDAFPTHAWLRPMLSLPTMPSVTAQFELSRPALPADRTTFAPGTWLACLSEQSRTTFRHVPGRLSVILAKPEALMSAAPEKIARLVASEAERLHIPIADHITNYRVIYQKDEFYDLSPGHDALRPSQKTPIRGLILAGDYTAQPLLGSMEGAVISGNRAAECLE